MPPMHPGTIAIAIVINKIRDIDPAAATPPPPSPSPISIPLIIARRRSTEPKHFRVCAVAAILLVGGGIGRELDRSFVA